MIGSLDAAHIASVADVWALTRRAEHAPRARGRGPAHLGQARLHRAVAGDRRRRRAPRGRPGHPGDQGDTARGSRGLRSRAASPAGAVTTIQNGLGAEEIVRRHGDWQLVSAVTFMSRRPARRRPRRVRARHRDLDGPVRGHRRRRSSASRRSSGCSTNSDLAAVAFPDLLPAQWSKLIFNATVNTVSGAHGPRPREPSSRARRI